MMRNPVFESSMKRRMRSWRSPLLITLYILFLLLVCGTALLTLQQDTISLGNLRSGLEAYVYLSIMQFMLIVLVAPALTAGSISGERERQTLDLLLCTRVGAFRIVAGKLFSSFCFLALMVVCSLPVMAITAFFGGVSFVDMLAMALFLLVSALACCAIGIFCSSVFKRTVTATVVSYLAIFALGIGTLVFPLIFQLEQLNKALQVIYDASNTAGGAASANRLEVLAKTPKLLMINPGIGLISLLVEQTGLLRATLEQALGWRGNSLFTLLDGIGSVSMLNELMLLGCSVILTGLSVFFVKPGGRKAKKRK